LELNEPYYFLRLYSVDLSTAVAAFKVLKCYVEPEVQYPVLRDLIVTYVRPFSTNQGREGKNVLSVKKHVPKTMRSLHGELVRARMQQFAHTDLTYYSPKVITSLGFGMSFKGFDYAALLRRLSDIEDLVKAVEASVNAEILQYHITDSPVHPGGRGTGA